MEFFWGVTHEDVTKSVLSHKSTAGQGLNAESVNPVGNGCGRGRPHSCKSSRASTMSMDSNAKARRKHCIVSFRSHSFLSDVKTLGSNLFAPLRFCVFAFASFCIPALLRLRERIPRTLCAPCAPEPGQGIPSPCPLPAKRGEGGPAAAGPGEGFMGREQQRSSCERPKADSLADRRTTILPLPEGEGRGEGEGAARPLNISRIAPFVCLMEQVPSMKSLFSDLHFDGPLPFSTGP